MITREPRHEKLLWWSVEQSPASVKGTLKVGNGNVECPVLRTCRNDVGGLMAEKLPAGGGTVWPRTLPL